MMKRTWQIGAWVTLLALLAVTEQAFERLAQAQQPSPVPQFDVDPFWPKMPEQWILGQVSGVAIDAQDHAREVARYAMGKRIRAVAQGPEGGVWLLEDGDGGRLLRLGQAQE